MKVSELIEKLNEIDGEAIVLASDNDGTEYHVAEGVCIDYPERGEKLLVEGVWCTGVTTVYLK